MHSSLGLKTQTPIGTQEKKKLKTIWQSLQNSNDSVQFRNPVDWKGMGLIDYTDYVKTPMDLSTINRKLREDKYHFLEEVLDDIQLIWDNCKSYNQSGSWIYRLAEKLQRSFKNMVKSYIPKLAIQDTTSREVDCTEQILKCPQDQVPQNQKDKLVQKLKYLSPEQLADVVQKISNECPQALQEKPDGFTIIIDCLSPNYFGSLSTAVNAYIEKEDRLAKKLKYL